MDEISTTIKDRILQIADFKRISKEKFIENLNQKYSNYKGISKKSAPSAEVIAEISSKHPDINVEWVLTGTGEMLKSNIDNPRSDNDTIVAQKKLIALQEKEIARLEKEVAELKSATEGVRYTKGATATKVAAPEEKLIK
ncbi:MAG TPA: hypothetical protein PKA53_12975 [Sphingobacterium sp.]|nr:hypothetical protein [Sphingobacterium sp.]